MKTRWSIFGSLLAFLAIGYFFLETPVFVSVLRLGLGIGLPSSCLGAAIGWLAAWIIYSLGGAILRWAPRGGEVILSLPWLWLLALVVQSWREEARIFIGFALIQVVRSMLWLLSAAQTLEVEPFLEGAKALGAQREWIFRRQMGPWLLPAVVRMAAEGAAAMVPLDLLLSSVHVGSGLQTELVDAALEGQRLVELSVVCLLATMLGVMFLVLQGYAIRCWERTR